MLQASCCCFVFFLSSVTFNFCSVLFLSELKRPWSLFTLSTSLFSADLAVKFWISKPVGDFLAPPGGSSVFVFPHLVPASVSFSNDEGESCGVWSRVGGAEGTNEADGGRGEAPREVV